MADLNRRTFAPPPGTLLLRPDFVSQLARELPAVVAEMQRRGIRVPGLVELAGEAVAFAGESGKAVRDDESSPSSRLLSRREAAAVLGVTPQRVSQLATKGELAQVEHRGRPHYHPDDVAHLVQERRNQPC